ncbi:hypothetical protein R5R35_014001 [Gryllus longicercus]|uniref:Uncharacterized protein n=1 Tax=Gryllus longicercus TaxID=2509291 RepID=A0AAN9VUB5_9ORTH
MLFSELDSSTFGSPETEVSPLVGKTIYGNVLLDAVDAWMLFSEQLNWTWVEWRVSDRDTIFVMSRIPVDF